MAYPANVIFSPWLTDDYINNELPLCRVPPQCVDTTGGSSTLEDMNAWIELHNLYKVATYTEEQSGGIQYSVLKSAGEPQYEDALIRFLITYPTADQPSYSIHGGTNTLYQAIAFTGSAMSSGSLLWSDGSYGEFPCGDSKLSFSYDTNPTNGAYWLVKAGFVRDVTIYFQCAPTLNGCPENTYYKNGECFPYPGYDEKGGKLPTGIVPSGSIEVISNDIDCTTIIETINNCSDNFFWEKPGCADFFSSSDYYQFMIEDKR